jgi:hypothetical protein
MSEIVVVVVPAEELTPEERRFADFLKAFCRGAIYGHRVATEDREGGQ